jgi:hypothetical protein
MRAEYIKMIREDPSSSPAQVRLLLTTPLHSTPLLSSHGCATALHPPEEERNTLGLNFTVVEA